MKETVKTDDPGGESLIEDISSITRDLGLPDPYATWLTWLVTFAIALSLVARAVGPVVGFFSSTLFPYFYRSESRTRGRLRQRFADHVESTMRRLNERQEWRDDKFSELEAEVEAEGRRGGGALARLNPLRRSQVRREKSLTVALKKSRERLILVEGDPGSGKSVALRHLAIVMAKRGMRSRSTRTVIPLYINLKDLRPSAGVIVNAGLIRDFVLETLNRANDRDISRFLDVEFEKGLEDGTWLFLFDSFDEIPAVLAATEADATVREYADAIYTFLHGMNACRGIVASRGYRGPRSFGWPKFRILALSLDRQAKMIKKTDLSRAQQKEIVGKLPEADAAIQYMAGNPLFLGLLCEFVRDIGTFPVNSHGVFENYVEKRFGRDATYLETRFALTADDLRPLAEHVAFTMSLVRGVGLAPERDSLVATVAETFSDPEEAVDRALSALEYIKLAKTEKEARRETFSFSHRRFQEYFATCVVLHDPRRVPTDALLLDARWYETAVTLLQLQSAVSKDALIERARAFVTAASEEPLPADRNDREPFTWPPGVLHVLSLLHQGVLEPEATLPADLSLAASRILVAAWTTGAIHDQKWALGSVGPARSEVRERMVREAFLGDSGWLKDVAFKQAARLGELPEILRVGVSRALVNAAAAGELNRNRLSLRALVMRLPRSRDFVRTMQALRLAPLADAAAHLMLVPLVVDADGLLIGEALGITTIITAHLTFYAVRASGTFAWRQTGWRSVISWLIPGTATRASSLFVGLYFFVSLRFVMFTTALIDKGSIPVWLLLTYLYLSTWGIAVLVLAVQRALGGLFELLVPQASAARAIARQLWSWVSERPISARVILEYLPVALAGAAFIGGFGFALMRSADWMAEHLYVFNIALAVVLLATAATVVRRLRPRVKDEKLLRELKRRSERSLAPADLLALLDAVHTPDGFMAVLEGARRDFVLSGEGTAELLQDLSRAARIAGDPDRIAEFAESAESAESASAPGATYRSEEFVGWITRETYRKYRLLRRSSPAALDELGRLTEQHLEAVDAPVGAGAGP